MIYILSSFISKPPEEAVKYIINIGSHDIFMFCLLVNNIHMILSLLVSSKYTMKYVVCGVWIK